MRKRFSAAAMVVIAMTLMVPAVLAATVTVTENNVGDDWFVVEQLVDGDYAFVEGPSTPPAGVGSLEMTAPNLGTDKVTITTNNHDGMAIADLDALTYWTYRDSSSTSPGYTVPSVNIFITNGGPEGNVGWAPLIWEPIYSFGAAAIQDDTWQQWDTMADSETGFGGGWWSTRDLGTICQFNCFVSWETVLEQNPNATIIVAGEGAGSTGVNLGRGPSGSFYGAVDTFAVTFGGVETIYDFEPAVGGPETKDDCKNGGWVDYGFKNQGLCIQFVNTGIESR
jgi:hypothetical protein